MAWNDLVAAANQTVLDTFAPTDATGAVDQVTYFPVGGAPSFLITMLPMDPLRLEGVNPGTFTLRWAKQADFAAQNCTPQRGDMLTLDAEDFIVEQIQEDTFGGVRLMIQKTNV